MNPELRRNLWLEFSPHRLVAMPAVIALVVVLILATAGQDGHEAIATTAAFGFIALVMLWGTQLAAASVLDEARARTWDAQRMSAIGPWAMTWGKLAGAASYAWYGGALLLAIFVLVGWGRLALPVARCAMILVAGAVFLQAMGLNASVLAARKGAAQRNTGGLALVVIALLLIAPAIGLVSGSQEDITWWHLRITHVDFLLASVTAYAVWAVLGAYRTMCSELEIRTLPWAFPLFTAFTAVYAAGFAVRGLLDDADGLLAVLLAGVLVALAGMYLLLFTEQTGASAWQRLVGRSRGGQWRRALEEMPVWSVALATGLVFALAAMLMNLDGGKGVLLREFAHAPLAIALFAVRDAALFQFFAFAREPRRVEAATLFYLALLYWLVPGLLSAVGATTAVEFFLPPLLARPGFSTVVVAAQAAIAIWLALWRWQQYHAMDRGAAAPGPAA